MCKDQWTLRHLLLQLDDTDIATLISQLNSNILPSDAFIDSLSLEIALEATKREKEKHGTRDNYRLGEYITAA